jgi:hypothetical protein
MKAYWYALGAVAILMLCASCAAFKEFVGAGGVEATGDAVNAAGDVATAINPAIGGILKLIGAGVTALGPIVKEGMK